MVGAFVVWTHETQRVFRSISRTTTPNTRFCYPKVRISPSVSPLHGRPISKDTSKVMTKVM